MRKELQKFINYIAVPACILSVSKEYHNKNSIVIECANSRYKEIMGSTFYDGMLYNELVKRDNRFEEYCLKSVIDKERRQAYAHIGGQIWVDWSILPLDVIDEVYSYCLFTIKYLDTENLESLANIGIESADFTLKAFIDLQSSDNFKESLSNILQRLICKTDADSCCIFTIEAGKKGIATYAVEFNAYKGKDKVNNEFKTGETKLVFTLFDTVADFTDKSEPFTIQTEEDMKLLSEKSVNFEKGLKVYGIERLIGLPLLKHNNVIGYLYCTNYSCEYFDFLMEVLPLLGILFCSEIENEHLIRKLEFVGSTDTLTQLNNRYAMSQYIKGMADKGNPHRFGVVSIDLNGLKEINDSQGHDKGDKLLCDAAIILREVFNNDNIFRIGGDEFVVIVKDVDKDAFNKMVMQLKSRSENNQYMVSLSIGACWSDGTIDVINALKQSDFKMYQDKTEYYIRTGKDRRKVSRIENRLYTI